MAADCDAIEVLLPAQSPQSPLLQLPAELLDAILKYCFLEGWIKSRAACGLGLRVVSRDINLSILRLISNDCSLRPDGDVQEGLRRALELGYPPVVVQQLLKRADVQPNYKDEHLETPLHWVVRSGHKEAVKKEATQLLLERKANIDADDKYGRTALHLACWWEYCNYEVVRLHVENGANINARDNNNRTALHYACGQMGSEEVASLLLENGADIKAEDKNGRRALHCACGEMGSEEVARLLLEYGADITAEDESNSTALYYACGFNWGGAEAVARLLLEKGANIEATNIYGRRALHRACDCYWRDEEVARLLLEYGADITAKDENGSTALHLAAREACKEILKLLLQNGANIKERDRNGLTALDLLSRNRPVQKEALDLVLDLVPAVCGDDELTTYAASGA